VLFCYVSVNSEVTVTAYPNVPGSRFTRTFDIADYFPARYDPASQIKDKTPIKFTTPAGARYFLKNISTDDLLKQDRTEAVYLEMLFRKGVRESKLSSR